MNTPDLIQTAEFAGDTPRRRWLLVAGIGLWAYLCHALLVLLYADALPTADQWDSEGYLLLKPWLEGKLTLAQLVSNHNEHRIFFKRLLDLLVFSVNGNTWDNRVFALANAAVYAAGIAMLGLIVDRLCSGLTRRVLLAFVLFLPLATVTIDNTLWGFQSPFYFSSLFAFAAFFLVARRETTATGQAFALLLGSAAILTLGSGFLVAAVVAAMLAARRLLGEQIPYAWTGAAVALAISLCGYAVMPALPHHAPAHAQGVVEFLETLNRVLSWPLTGLPLAWLPLLIWLLVSWQERRPPKPADWFFLGISLWIGLQVAAIAYGRGHATPVVPSRYTEFLLAGVAANVYFCCAIFANRTRPEPARAEAPLALLAITASLVMLVYHCILAAYPIEHRLRNAQAGRLVLDGMLAGVPVADNHVALPFPFRDKLAWFLTDPTIKVLLQVENDRVLEPCAPQRTGLLTRAICALERGVGKPALPAFVPAATTDAIAPVAEDLSRCNLEIVDSGPVAGTLSRLLPTRFFGWAGPGLPPLQSVGSTGVLRLEGTAGRYEIPLGTPIRRPDVAQHFRNPVYLWSGFDMMVSTAGLPAGDYAVVLLRSGARACTAAQRLHVP